MIQQVGFKNFRRFAEFPMMNFGGINIFVGRNNAGKSTVLKALMLMKGNLNTLGNYVRGRGSLIAESRPMFAFDVDQLASLHIDDFKRALYNKAERKEITLSSTIDGCTIATVLDGQSLKEGMNYVAVPYNRIELKDERMTLLFDFATRDLSMTVKGMSTEEARTKLDEARNIFKEAVHEEFRINDKLKAVNKQIKASIDGGGDLLELIDEKEQIEKTKKSIIKKLSDQEQTIAKLESELSGGMRIEVEHLPDFIDEVKVNVIAKVFSDMLSYAHMKTKDVTNADQRSIKFKKVEELQKVILSMEETLRNEQHRFVTALSHFNLEYIHAHAASQKTIYLKDDKNDILSVAIAEFCKARIAPGDKEWQFIKTWLGELGIGDDFSINSIQSAGYTLSIKENGEVLNLADKGTGSIQLMTLLFSLANIMHKVNNGGYVPTILIEEPEQNIHPMLQSMLADMFAEFRDNFQEDWKPQLIIETHSEYLIRRTQLIVAEKEYSSVEDMLSDNPFKVFYFPSDKRKAPYDMEYQTNGMFVNKFDTGFFDEAGNAAINLMSMGVR